jgi:hypothetical protein
VVSVVNQAVAPATQNIKQYVGLVRDHSGSMSGLQHAALKDYNANLETIKTASVKEDIDTILNVVAFEHTIDLVNSNSSVTGVRPLQRYPTGGGSTPLIQAVMKLIEHMEKVPDARDKNVSFLVMATTDGQENVADESQKAEFARKVKQLQATDRWTFTFRTPHGGRGAMERLGIPGHNVQEWEQTERGMQDSTSQNVVAVANFYSGRNRGLTGSSNFYANAAAITPTVAKQTLTDISGSVRIFPVDKREEIQPFFMRKLKFYVPGTGFYQLTKPEKAVQSYKGIIIRNKKTGSVYAGQSARDLLGIPTGGTIKLVPGDHGQWDIFVQSISNNRILYPGTSVVHWADGR